MQLFAKKPTDKEQLRTAQRDIGRSVRELDRELMQLAREEAKLITQIKGAAKQNQTATAKVLAKSLVRMRAQKTRLITSKAQLQGVGVNMMTASVTGKVAESLGHASKVMVAANADPQKVMQNARKFAEASARMDASTEMVDDALESATGDDEEEETDEIVNQVLDEIGVDTSAVLNKANVPQHRAAHPQQQAAAAPSAEEAEDKEAADLVARLAALK